MKEKKGKKGHLKLVKAPASVERLPFSEEDEDGSGELYQMTTQLLNVMNAAKGWARKVAGDKKTRGMMKPHERRLFDAVQYLFMSEGKLPLDVPLSQPQQRTMQIRGLKPRRRRRGS